MNIKMVIVVRTDLNMRKGKMCAQVAHASMKVLLDHMNTEYKQVPVFPIDINTHEIIGECIPHEVVIKSMMFDPGSPWDEWLNGLFTKIVVGVESLEKLRELQLHAAINEIPHAIIEDAGQTEFKEVCQHCGGAGMIPSFNGPHDIDIPCEYCCGTGKINKPTITCLAIGPDHSELIDQITGGLKLL